MFLKIQGVTGESSDSDHQGEIQVVSWSWGMQSPSSMGGQAIGKVTMGELRIVKKVDLSSPTLMSFLRNHKPVPLAVLSIRKAGQTPLEYFKIELEHVRVTSWQAESENAELVERLSLGFTKFRASYIPQSATGARGGGTNVFEADVQSSQ